MSDSFDTSNLKYALVGIDPETHIDVFEAWVRTDYRWNGWAVPVFPEHQLEKIIAWINRGGISYYITHVGDTVYMVDNEDQDELTRETPLDSLWPTIAEPIMVNGERCYDIGGCSWTWSEVDRWGREDEDAPPLDSPVAIDAFLGAANERARIFADTWNEALHAAYDVGGTREQAYAAARAATAHLK